MKKPTSQEKLRELILYVSQKCADDKQFGLVKLNKIMCFVDFLHYGHFGESITGQDYIKMPQGPMPKDFYKVKRDMENKKEVVEMAIPVINFHRKQLIATRQPDYTVFTSEQIAFIDSVISAFEKTNGKGASEFSHKYLVGWQDINYNEEIPYQTIFLPNATELTDEDKLYAKELVKKYGWDRTYGWSTQ